MKKVKEYLFIISFAYMALIILFIIGLFIYKRPYVTLTTPERIPKDFASLRTRVDKLKDSECKNELSRLLDDYSTNSYNGKVRINDLYEFISSEKIINDFQVMNSKCNFSNSDLYNYGIENKYLVKMSSQDKILQSYLYQYELGFIDEMTVDYNAGMSKMAYNTIKYTEVELINDYINMIEGR